MEMLIEATVGLAGAASSVALYRGIKRRLCPSQEERDFYAMDGSMAGRTVLVTGANSGVGRAAAEILARKGAHVMCACRDMPKAEATASAINRRLPRTVPPSSSPCGRASPAPAPLDLASLASVRAFVDAFERERGEEGEEEQKRNEDRRLRRREPRLHVLVNNAGALFPKRELVDVWKREEQEGRGEGEGKRESLLVERTMATNHLGPFLLTALLLPTLKETGRAEGRPSRVVMVSSRLEKGKGEYLDCWVRDPTLTPAEDQDPKEEGEEEGGPVASPPYRPFLAYGASKLANLLAVTYLHRQQQGWSLPDATHQPPTTTTPPSLLLGPSTHRWDPSDQHVSVYGCTPGMVHTALNRSLLPGFVRVLFWPLSYSLLQTPFEGARPVVFLAASDRVEGRGGGFWALEARKKEEERREKGWDVVEVASSPEAEDIVLAHKLWVRCEEMVAPFSKT
ncbi:retinol dehydrogenase 14 [Nannochloropsis gaditana CCMP526]|uniref:retinol dehydrogenase 14 n=1 Tax=Nannochloropsis gaditana (strain CCMP526) TaxID=1093141 RepID=UPI00029F58F3|nr:retinol dehydrogenase 14 [Nannochloropsis gaditana CCMP526]EKU22391.1 retinol dehydrogenase 14 [Nannochloropsis gaditana CCMP526]|eukprot:XP_005853966.1 retinol dehydrogenase 14 [Nannochloropsis gaditana CCMP526]